MGDQELLEHAEQISAELRMKRLASEDRHPWLEEAVTVCAIATAVAVVVVLSAVK